MSGILINSLYAAEPVLMVVALFALWRSNEWRRFRALSAYFVLRLVSFVVLQGLLHLRQFVHVSRAIGYSCYFYGYWLLYIAGAIAVFFVILELFKSALEPLPGLKRLGLIAFRWVACVSSIAAAAAVIIPGAKGSRLLLQICDQMMRCESIFLLSLLFFLMISAGKLGLSYRSRVFGVSFGFGIMAASNLVVSAFLLKFNINNVHIAASSISILDTSAGLLTMMVWSAYFFQQEPARHAVATPATSPLSRWNDIAMVLGPSKGRIGLAAPASEFFLQDVEKVVDRILSKNSLNAAS